ncbi:MAG TPA: hypothetical protein VIE90_10770 [Candidatus Binatia bacterium]
MVFILGGRSRESGRGTSHVDLLNKASVGTNIRRLRPAVIFAKGLNELAFMGDIVQFPQNGFGATEKKISESPDQIYRMVRASLRGLRFVSEPEEPARSRGHRHEEHKVSDRKLAEQMLVFSKGRGQGGAGLQ